MLDRHAPLRTLRRFFAGLTEQTFQSQLGVADPPLLDYIAELLTRFVRCEDIFSIRNLTGKRLDQLAGMLAEAQQRQGEARRKVHRHIGDFTLFWTGVYPEMLERLRGADRQDSMLDYLAHGKRSYYIASTIPVKKEAAPADVLERLSQQFELCAYGLGQVRQEWERRDGDDAVESFLIN